MKKKKKKKLTGVLTVTLVVVEASLAAPVVVFEDDFNDEPFAGINVTPEAWVLAAGSVDIIGEGTASDFFPGQGYGYYIDLDGGPGPDPGANDGPAGALVTAIPILFQTGCTYTLTFDLAGSQFPSDQPTETVGVGVADMPGTYADVFTRDWMDPFTTETVEFPGDGRSHWIVFHNLQSSDNIGALLDNVVLTEECDDPCRVPAPGAVLLGSLGATLVGFFRRRCL